MVAGFLHGFLLPLRAARLLLGTRRVKRYALLPLLANLLLYLFALGLFLFLVAEWDWGAYAAGWMGSWGETLLNAWKWILLVPAALVVTYVSFTAVGMVVASPVNDLLSERVEQALCGGGEDGATTGPWFRAMLLSLLDSLWIVLRQGAATLLVLPLLLVPVAGWIPLFLVTAYYSGLGFLDVGMARHLLRGRHKRPVLRARRWELLGLGVAMELLFLVPLLGLLLLPLGVTAGTILYCEADWDAALGASGLEPPPGFRPPRIGGRGGGADSPPGGAA